jgi:pyruvate dehydrogenase E1 component
VIKVIWGSDWDKLLAADKTGLLLKRMEEAVDGDYQKYSVEPGSYTRRHFFSKYPELLELVKDRRRPARGYAAAGVPEGLQRYKRAVDHKGGPSVVLAFTIKGYGLGEAGEGRNVTHQQKKLNESEMQYFSQRFDVPIPEKTILTASFYRPPDDAPEEMQYLHQRRRALGGYLPARKVKPINVKAPALGVFADVLEGSKGRAAMTTSGLGSILRVLLKEHEIGKLIVPIIPDEARTFGMEALFRQVGIYASQGQLYKPVDSDLFLFYKEAKDGQILEEGITEAGSLASFTAAGAPYQLWGADDPILHLLLDVRLPKVGDESGSAIPGKELHHGRHRRHHAG